MGPLRMALVTFKGMSVLLVECYSLPARVKTWSKIKRTVNGKRRRTLPDVFLETNKGFFRDHGDWYRNLGREVTSIIWKLNKFQ